MTSRAKALFASLFFLCLAPGTVAGWIPYWIAGWESQPPFFGLAALRWLAVLPIAAGLLILGDSFLRFALEGIGTPAPVYPTQHLVVSGLYRYTRNPMYIAVLSLLSGQTLWFASPLLGAYAAAVWVAFHLFVILYEEPILRKTYGKEYEEYCARVPRWIGLRPPMKKEQAEAACPSQKRN